MFKTVANLPTNFNPLPRFKIPMVALFVQWVWVITMFVGDMAHE